MPRVLLLAPGHDDFLTDSLFHGLRSLLGERAVDYPRIDHLYRGHRPLGDLHGRGFTLAGLLDDVPVDRNRLLDRAENGEFDAVVFSDIWRNFGAWVEWAPRLEGRVRLAVLDGADRVEPYPYSGLWWRVRHWWLVPRAHRRATYFKREITPWMYWFGSYLALPPRVARALGVLRGVRPISFSIPEQRVVGEPPPKDRLLATHVVDPEVAARLGGQGSYAFEDAESYYGDLRRSRFGVTVKRAGWDALRHYEIAASGTVPCFRRLEDKPGRAAPFGLRDGVNCVSYRDADDLATKLAGIDERRYASLQGGALDWARANTTRVRAEWFLRELGLA
jgi:hypothetical protein